MNNIMLDLQDTSTWHVLIVDDEPDNLEVVSETLEFFGAQTRKAADGVQGLDALQTFAANLILLDLSMPKMNGWEMRTRIKANTNWANIPVIALTAHAMIGDAERALAAGFDGYLTKPLNVVNLIDQIRTYIDPKKPITSGEKAVE